MTNTRFYPLIGCADDVKAANYLKVIAFATSIGFLTGIAVCPVRSTE